MSIIKEFLQQSNWAVIGVSSDPNKYGYKVYKKLKSNGYNVFPINPKVVDIEGDHCYPNLKDLPIIPDAINTVVPPSVTEQVVKECTDLGIKRIWMQPGSENNQAINYAEHNCIQVVHNECILIAIDKAAH